MELRCSPLSNSHGFIAEFQPPILEKEDSLNLSITVILKYQCLITHAGKHRIYENVIKPHYNISSKYMTRGPQALTVT